MLGIGGKVRSALSKTSRWIVPVALFGTSLAAYLSTLTHYYTFDAVAYATQIRGFVETGRAGWLLHPHHLLFNSMGLAAWSVTNRAGLQVDTLLALQYMNAFFGALGLVVLYEMLRRGGFRLSGEPSRAMRPGVMVSLAAAVALGSAYGYWICATDGRVTMPELVGAILTLGLAWGMVESPTRRQAAALAGATVLTILLHQSSGLLIPAGVGAIVLSALPWRRRLRMAAAYVIAVLVTTALIYAAAGFVVKGTRSLAELQAWALAYAHDGRWWSFDLGQNLVASGSALARVFTPSASVAASAVIPLIPVGGAVLGVLAAAALVINRPLRDGLLRPASGGLGIRLRMSIVLGLMAVSYASFFTVWTPGYFPFWLPVGFVLIAGLALIGSGWNARTRQIGALVWCAVSLAIAYGSLSTAIMPATARATNPHLALCDALREHVAPGDLVLLTGAHNHAAPSYAEVYIPYFLRASVRTIANEIKRASQNVPAAVRSTRGVIRDRIMSGHDVFALPELLSPRVWSALERMHPGSYTAAQSALSGYQLTPAKSGDAATVYRLTPPG